MLCVSTHSGFRVLLFYILHISKSMAMDICLENFVVDILEGYPKALYTRFMTPMLGHPGAAACTYLYNT